MSRRSRAALLAAAFFACSPTSFDRYQQAHPDWKPDFPKPGVDAGETVASIYAPHEIERGSITEVHKLRVFAVSPSIRELDLETFERGVPGESILVANVACSAPKPLGWFYNDAVSWLVLRDGRLAAWHFFEFQEYCHGVATTRPLESPSAATVEAIRQALYRVTDPANADSLVTSATRPAARTPAEADVLGERTCPGRVAFVESLRDALLREPSIHTHLVSHDLLLTVAIEPDGSVEVRKIRPTDFFARQIVQQVRKVSGSPDRPVAPACLLGSELDLAFPR